MIEEQMQNILSGKLISFENALKLSKVNNKEKLFKAADNIRKHFCGNVFDLCSITNAKSGACSEDCKWCSQSAFFKTDIEKYEIADKQSTVDEAINNASKGVKRHSLVTSGRRVSNKTLDMLIPIYKEIKEKTGMGLCASMGLITEEQLKRLKDEGGVKNYHCNLETAPSYFSKLVTTHTIEEKIETITNAQKLGINVCSGGIIGMGETMPQRIELAITLRELGIMSIPINILSPIKGTPMENTKALAEEEILTTIAVFRFINPKAYLRLCGGRLQIKSFQNKVLKSGVNAALTGDYLTTSGSNIDDDIKDFTNAGFSI